METRLLSRFKIISINRVLIIFVICLTGGIKAIASPINSNSNQRTKRIGEHSLPIKETITFSTPSLEILLPMPIGEIDASSDKVESTRNPFQEPSALELSDLDGLNSAIQFNGIAKSGDSLVAMIKTEQGQKIYKVGDSLGNGFIIKSISSNDVTVDISNGSRSYRLSLKTLEK